MKNTLVLAAVIAVGAFSQARADHSLLPPRAQSLFPKMGGHDQAVATSSANTVSQTYAGTAAKAQASKSATATSRTADPDLVSRPVYTGKWPFASDQQRFEVAPLKHGGKECDANCTKACCEKK
jgi:hypothetical protein